MNCISRKHHNLLQISLLTFIYQEEGKYGRPYICLSPALKFSGYGESKQEATRSFKIEDFINYSLNKKILGANLADLGWGLADGEQWGEIDFLDHKPSLEKMTVSGLPESVVETFSEELEMAY